MRKPKDRWVRHPTSLSPNLFTLYALQVFTAAVVVNRVYRVNRRKRQKGNNDGSAYRRAGKLHQEKRLQPGEYRQGDRNPVHGAV